MNSEGTESLDRSTPDPAKAKENHPSRAAQNRFHPLKLFTDNAWAARMWCLLSLGLLGLVVIQPFFIINAYRTRERVIIMDAAGTFSIAPTLDFEEATRLHEEMALWSTYALFSQNPNGFDMPELLEKMFLDEPPEASSQTPPRNSGRRTSTRKWRSSRSRYSRPGGNRFSPRSADSSSGQAASKADLS